MVGSASTDGTESASLKKLDSEQQQSPDEKKLVSYIKEKVSHKWKNMIGIQNLKISWRYWMF